MSATAAVQTAPSGASGVTSRKNGVAQRSKLKDAHRWLTCTSECRQGFRARISLGTGHTSDLCLHVFCPPTRFICLRRFLTSDRRRLAADLLAALQAEFTAEHLTPRLLDAVADLDQAARPAAAEIECCEAVRLRCP